MTETDQSNVYDSPKDASIFESEELERKSGQEVSNLPDDSLLENSNESRLESETTYFKRSIEAILMVATEPLGTKVLAEAVGITSSMLEGLCKELQVEYERDLRGFRINFIAGGYRFESHPEMADVVEKFILEDQVSRISPAALETLAIVAYRQPISRAQISAIRGVNADGVVRLLAQRGLISAVGKDEGPGQAILFGTTDLFLEKMGFAHISDLPALSEFIPSAEEVETLEQILRPTVDD
ncbi:MAG: SMC-Scp complex subunit ScpB [Acidimicrobiales bacterium]|nr:SMC-Scp complex subunit ScpB [Acidimicrobiales bacterium]